MAAVVLVVSPSSLFYTPSPRSTSPDITQHPHRQNRADGKKAISPFYFILFCHLLVTCYLLLSAYFHLISVLVMFYSTYVYREGTATRLSLFCFRKTDPSYANLLPENKKAENTYKRAEGKGLIIASFTVS